MFGPYVDLLRRPGALAMSTAGFVARLPLSMAGLGILLLVSLHSGQYGIAGALAATEALAEAAAGPFFGRAVDRLGQRRVLPLLVGGHIAALIVFVGLVLSDAPTPVLFLAVAVQGALLPNIGAMVRARWAFLLAGDPPRLRTAFAYESVVDEFVFIAGPPLATILAVYVVGWGALGACAVLMAVGSFWLLRERSTEPPPSGVSASGAGSALRYPGLLAITGVSLMLGGVFGSLEVATVAFADEAGVRGAAGWLLAIYSLGSAGAGLVLGASRLTVPLPRQLLVTSAALAIVTLPFPFMGSLSVLGLVLLLSGLACSPVLISSYALIERLIPNARLTEGLVWTNTGLLVGLAFAAGAAGSVVDVHGASAAYAICTGCAVGTFVVAGLGYLAMARAWNAEYPSPALRPGAAA